MMCMASFEVKLNAFSFLICALQHGGSKVLGGFVQGVFSMGHNNNRCVLA